MPISFHPAAIYGGSTPPLTGKHIVGDPYFAIFGDLDKKKPNDKASYKTFAVIPVTPVGTEEVIELRYSVGFADRVLPATDPETFAVAGEDGKIHGPFLKTVKDDDDFHLSEQYDTFPRFWRKLSEAGAPDDLLASVGEKGLTAISGIVLDFAHLIEKYKDKEGKEQERQPFNYPIKGGFAPAGGASKAAGKKGGSAKAATTVKTAAATTAAAKPAAAAPDDDLDAAASAIYDKVLEGIIEKIASEEAVTRDEAARGVFAVNTELGLGVPAQKLLIVQQGVKGTGARADQFNQKVEEAGLKVDSQGAFSAV